MFLVPRTLEDVDVLKEGPVWEVWILANSIKRDGLGRVVAEIVYMDVVYAGDKEEHKEYVLCGLDHGANVLLASGKSEWQTGLPVSERFGAGGTRCAG